MVKIWSHPAYTFPAEIKKGDTLLSYFIFHNVTKCPFHALFNDIFFTFFWYFLLVNSFVGWFPI